MAGRLRQKSYGATKWFAASMSQAMQVLVSVNSAIEAQLALTAGVPLIDLKDTSHGALAALDIDISEAIVATVHAHRQKFPAATVTMSATVGDRCASATDLITLIEDRLRIGVEVIKLPEAIWADSAYQSIIGGVIARSARMIAVLVPGSLNNANLANRLQWLAQQGYWGVMVDTQQKSRALVDIVAIPALAKFVSTAKSLHLHVGLAGGLSLTHVESLAMLGPDYLGFRSGVCADGQRSQGLLAERLNQLVCKVSGDLLDNWSQTH